MPTKDNGGLDYKISTSAQLDPMKMFNNLLIRVKSNLKDIDRMAKRTKSVSSQMKSAGTSAAAKAQLSKSERDSLAILRQREATRRRILALQDKQTQKLKRQEILERQRSANLAKEQRLKNNDARSEERRLAILQKQENLRRRAAQLKDKTIRKLTIENARQQALLTIEKQQAHAGDAKLNKHKQILALTRARNNLESKAALLADQKLASLRSEEAYTRRIAAARQKVALQGRIESYATANKIGNAQELQALGISKTRGVELGLLPKSALKGTTAIKKLSQSLGQLRNSLRNLALPLSSILQGLVAFASVRLIARGIRTLISAMVKFNATIEQAKIGIGALFAQLGQIRGSFGEAQEGPKAFETAIKIADVQLKKLRIDAQKTAATFQELTEAFQTALGPGLTAGLDIDQVRKFTVQISQAASAIGLPQNQLAEEIRSLLAGTMTPKNTRIATVLEITKADIRRAKEAGNLMEFLSKRFSEFSRAGQRSLNTWQAITTNLLDAFAQVSEVAGAGFFQGLKDTLVDIKDLFVVFDKQKDAFELNPRTLQAFKYLSDRLSDVVLRFRELLVEGNGAKNLYGIIEGIGDVIKSVSLFVLGFAKQMLSFIESLRRIFRLFGLESGNAAESMGAFAAKVVVSVTAIRGMISATRILIPLIQSGQLAFTKMADILASYPHLYARAARAGSASMAVLGKATAVAAVAAASFLASFAATTKVISAIKGPINDASGEALGFFTELKLNVVALGYEFSRFADRMVTAFKTGFIALKKFAFWAFDQVKAAWINGMIAIITGMISGLEKVGLSKRLGEALGVDMSDVKEELKKSKIEAKGFLEVLKDIDRATLEASKNLESRMQASEQKERAEIAGILGYKEDPYKKSSGPTQGQVRTRALVDDLFDSSVGTVVSAKGALSEGAEEAKKIEDSMKRAEEAFSKAKASFGLTGTVKSLADLTAGADADRLERTKKIQDQITSLSAQNLKYEKELGDATEKVLNLDEKEVGIYNKLLQLRRAEAQLSAQVAQASEEEAKALKTKQETIRNQAAEALSAVPGPRQQVITGLAAQTMSSTAGAETTSSGLDAARTRLKETEAEILALRIKQGQTLAIQQGQAQEMATERQRIATLQEMGMISRQEAAVQIKETEMATLDIEISRTRQLIEQAEKLGVSREELDLMYNRLNELVTKQAENNEKLEEAKLHVGGISEGIALAVQKMKDEMPTAAERMASLFQSISDRIGNELGNAIVDALNPDDKAMSLKERFAKLFRDIANNIIKELTKAAVMKAVTSVFGAAEGGLVGGGQAVGKANGGFVQGFASGGSVLGHPRPKHIDSRDTVPAWLRPGEYVLKPKAVRSLGKGFVSMLNNFGSKALDFVNTGMVNPGAGLSGLQEAHAVKSFAEGGFVGDMASQGVESRAPSVYPVFVANESSLEMMLAEGQEAFRSAMRANQDVVQEGGRSRNRNDF